ncbi:MAG: VWA domain-containing protein [Solirubrobacterales bacterium]|nr:VWA domain-containing protein [Solirubrobacterales bacterium]
MCGRRRPQAVGERSPASLGASTRFINALDNPPLPTSCGHGLRVLLLLDTSGSTSGHNNAYKTAANTFINTLSDTPTNLKISSFATNSSPDNTTQYDLNTVTGQNDAKTRVSNIYPNNTSGSGYTNWDAALNDAAAANVDVIVFVTDGNPTVRQGKSPSGANGTIDDITYGVASANTAKSPTGIPGDSGSQTILGVGVGTGMSTANLSAVSGPTDGTDYTTASDPSALAAVLKAIAAKICGGTITVNKTVVPSDSAGRFDLKIDGVAKATDVGDGGTTGKTTAAVGDHTITEAGHAGTSLSDYTQELACADSKGAVDSTGGVVNVAADQDIVCTFTNTRKWGTLKIVKSLTPASDSGLFDLRLDGLVKKSDAANGGNTGDMTVNSGTHTVSETAGSVGSLSDYTSSILCKDGLTTVASGSGTSIDVTIEGGSSVICTVSNTLKAGSIEVVKSLSPNTDPGLFDLKIDGTTKKTDATDGGTTGAVTVKAGTHVVSEVAGSVGNLADYTSSILCLKGDERVPPTDGTSLEVTVADGDHIKCTITNTRKTGGLTITKSLSPNTDPGLFDLKLDGTTKKTDATDGGTTGGLTLNTGKYTVSEAAGSIGNLADYTSSILCKDGDTTVASADATTVDVTVTDGSKIVCTVTMTDGSKIVCTVTNTRKTGGLTITKSLSPNTDPGLFDLKLDGSTKKTDATDGGTTGGLTLNTGKYTVSEAAGSVGNLADYTSSILCKDGDTTVASADATTVDVTVTDGSKIVCTVTNTRKTGGLTITKSLSPNTDPGLFDLKLDGTTKKTDATDGGTTGGLTLNTGKYTVSEAAGSVGNLADYTSSVLCKDGDTTVASADATTVDVTITDGSKIVCTITNTRNTATIVIAKTVPGGSATQFGFTGPLTDPISTFSLVDGGTKSFDVATGDYKVTEDITAGFVLDSIVCSDANDDGGESTGSVVDRTASISLQPGETVTCTFTNNPSGQVLASAIARGTTGCARTAKAYIRVSGTGIRKVTFYRDGKKKVTMTKPNYHGRYYLFQSAVSKLSYGSHRFSAVVGFVTGANPTFTKFLRHFSKCGSPRLTG